MAFRLPCQVVSDTIVTLPHTLGIIDAKVNEDSIWTLPQISPAGSLAKSVIPGEILIVRNITPQNVMLVAHPNDNIDGFRDATVSAESSVIISAMGNTTWSVLVSAQLQMLVSNSSANLLPSTPTGQNTGATGQDSGSTGQDTDSTDQDTSSRTSSQSSPADRRANMPMTRIHGLVKKV